MARTCYLHLGMHKTGTTAIQAACFGYDDGRVCSVPFPYANHSRAMITLFCTDAERYYLNQSAGLTGRALERDRNRLRRQFDQAMGSGKDILISGEGLTVGLFQPADIAGLIEKLGRNFDHIEACAYIRPPQSFMISEFQQVLKTGRPDLRVGAFYPYYKNRFEKWETALPDGALTYRFYTPESFPKDALLRSFAQWAGLEFDRLIHPARRINRSLSAEALAIVFFAHRAARNGALESALNLPELVSHLQGFGRRQALPNPVAMARVLEKNAADIAWMTDRLGAPILEQPLPEDAVGFTGPAVIENLARRFIPIALRRLSGRIETGKTLRERQGLKRSFALLSALNTMFSKDGLAHEARQIARNTRCFTHEPTAEHRQ